MASDSTSPTPSEVQQQDKGENKIKIDESNEEFVYPMFESAKLDGILSMRTIRECQNS